MGCDIRILLQRFDQGEWATVHTNWKEDLTKGDYKDTYDLKSRPEAWNPFGYLWRDYTVFGFLAGVRHEAKFEPICEPRGWPDGFDSEVRLGDHSHSWLLLSEIISTWDTDMLKPANLNRDPNERQLADCAWFVNRCRVLEAEYPESRIVFGFD
jgi:hypothetical protein